MKKMGWLVTGALVAGGVVFARGGCLSGGKAPDQKLAAQYVDTCKIARLGATDPVRGVKKLGVYFVKHGGEMVGNFVDTIAAIERISDDEKHDARARLARDRWNEAFCPAEWDAFSRAIDGSPEAQQILQHVGDRLSRTLEIILSGGQMDRMLKMPNLLNFEFPAGRLGTQTGRAGHADVAKP
jgi:hypothetical protein